MYLLRQYRTFMLKNSLIAAITIVALVACGYSGPLYLPQNADKQPGATSKNQFAPTNLAQVESSNESSVANKPARKSLLPAMIVPESANVESTNLVESNSKINQTVKS